MIGVTVTGTTTNKFPFFLSSCPVSCLVSAHLSPGTTQRSAESSGSGSPDRSDVTRGGTAALGALREIPKKEGTDLLLAVLMLYIHVCVCACVCVCAKYERKNAM